MLLHFFADAAPQRQRWLAQRPQDQPHPELCYAAASGLPPHLLQVLEHNVLCLSLTAWRCPFPPCAFRSVTESHLLKSNPTTTPLIFNFVKAILMQLGQSRAHESWLVKAGGQRRDN